MMEIGRIHGDHDIQRTGNHNAATSQSSLSDLFLVSKNDVCNFVFSPLL